MSEQPPSEQPSSIPGLPLRGSKNPPRRPILASHLIFTGYSHWLPNDLRGSGSTEVRNEHLGALGEILPGRQKPQPPRRYVEGFSRDAQQRIDNPLIWFDERQRDIIGRAFDDAAKLHGYTLWALAVCSNHAHVVVRTHRDRSEVIWMNLARAARLALQEARAVPEKHPVWSHRCYKVFLHTPGEVRGRIQYVNDNPLKERLPRQNWEFIVPYFG
jgi:REP element-mobilizing transposase RayT